MVPFWFGRWAEELVSALQLQANEQVLDIACGTGVTTRMARKAVGLNGIVDGLDVNNSMLSKAKEMAEGSGIGWIEGDITNSDIPSSKYDVVLSQHGYHYFPDKHGALTEILRFLKPGGRMAFSIWDGHSPYTSAICDAVERYISPEVAAKQRSQRTTPTAQELETQVCSAGFSDVRVERQELMIDVPLAVEFVPIHLGSMPIAGAFAALDQAAQNSLISEVSQAMQPFVFGDRMVYADAVNVVYGRPN